MKVKVIKCVDSTIPLDDITIGKVYEVVSGDFQDGDEIVPIVDDNGEDNELYFGEYEVVDE